MNKFHIYGHIWEMLRMKSRLLNTLSGSETNRQDAVYSIDMELFDTEKIIYTCMLYEYILFEYIYKIKKKTHPNSEFVTSDCWQCPGVRYSWGTWRWTSPTVNTPSWLRGTRASTSRPCSAGSTIITRTDAPGRPRNVTSPTENRMWERSDIIHVHNKRFLEISFLYIFNHFFFVWP